MMWLYWHMIALGEEYTKRYGKKHLNITKCMKTFKKTRQIKKTHTMVIEQICLSVCQMNIKINVVLKLTGTTT